MLKYGKEQFDIENRHPLNVDRQSLGLIPQKARVLDIGCATGFMGEYLMKEKECRVTGVELRDEEFKQAKKKLTDVLHLDIEHPDAIKNIKDTYDIILFSALLEHLKDPETVLKIIKKLLKKNGYIIATVPNVAHWSMRLHFLKGNFEYEDYGILDRTHLKFFTIKTFKELFENAGYVVDAFLIDPVGGGFPKMSMLLSKIWPNLFAYQLIIKALPRT